MADIDFKCESEISELSMNQSSNCENPTRDFHENPSDGLRHDHDHDRIDGGGEPCPTPLMWQEVRETFLRDSEFCEIIRGAHRLSVRTTGTGTPLYFLNNFAATAELFSLTIWLLREKFRCIVFDATTDDRQSARSTKPTMSEFAADLFAVADHFGNDQIAVYGAGFGAGVAIQAALDQPDRLSRLILQHGFSSRRLSLFERLLTSACLYSGQTLNQLPQRRRFQAVNHKPWFPPYDQSRFDFLVESTGTLPLRDLARRAQAVNTFNATGQLSTIKCPVTLIRTEGEGRLAAESQSILEKELKRPQIEWMHSAGQHPYLTHPHRIAKIIQNQFQTEN